MAILTQKRQTLLVWNESWQKYAEMKRKHLLEHGSPEITFTEFANACMFTSRLTLSELLEVRRQHTIAKLEKKLKDEDSNKP